MTKQETTFTFTRCNLCDSSNIRWNDKEDIHHLCNECYNEKPHAYDNEDIGDFD